MDEADGLDVGDFDETQHGENQNSTNFAEIRAKIVADSAKKLETFRFVRDALYNCYRAELLRPYLW